MKFVNLQELCEIKTGKMDANHATVNGKYRFYTCANNYSYCDTKSFSGPSVIVPGNGDIGLVFYYDGEFEAYQRTYVLQNIKCNPKYLYYHFVYQWRALNTDKQYGSTVRYVRMSNFTSYKVPIVSEEEQSRIVNYIETMLSKLDESVETLQKTKQQLSVYRQAVIEATIAEGKRNTDCVHLFSDFVKKYQNGISKRKGVGVPTIVLRLADIDNQNIKNNGDFRTIDLSENEREKYLINEQELLIIRVNGSAENVGRIIVVSEDNKYAVCDHFIRCTLDDTRIVPEYVKLHFNSMQTRKFINSNMVSTAGQNTISQTTLNNIQLFVPNIEKQQQLLEVAEERLSICNSIENTVDSALRRSEALRQSILKQAFEGEI